MTIRAKIESLGLTLPPPPKAAGNYVPSIRTGNLLLLSGQLPFHNGELLLIGKVGPDGHMASEGALAAKQCALNALSVVDDAVGLDNVVRVVRLGAFVNSTPGFTAQPAVANGASDLMVEIFGDAGRHVRSAVGVNELPLDAAVEIDFIFEVK
jgi:enamine deaminase RidA (YjgF/YER057c/UK114 family)